MQTIKRYFSSYFELTVWITAIISLALMDPALESHYSLCVFKWIGFSFCPGCGLGHSISWLLRGEFIESFKAHPLGFFAIAVLLHRIYSLIKKQVFLINSLKQQHG